MAAGESTKESRPVPGGRCGAHGERSERIYIGGTAPAERHGPRVPVPKPARRPDRHAKGRRQTAQAAPWRTRQSGRANPVPEGNDGLAFERREVLGGVEAMRVKLRLCGFGGFVSAPATPANECFGGMCYPQICSARVCEGLREIRQT